MFGLVSLDCRLRLHEPFSKNEMTFFLLPASRTCSQSPQNLLVLYHPGSDAKCLNSENRGKINLVPRPGSLSTASLCHWEKDPGCGWSPVTTQILGGNVTICWAGGEAVWNLPMKIATNFCRLHNIENWNQYSGFIFFLVWYFRFKKHFCYMAD